MSTDSVGLHSFDSVRFASLVPDSDTLALDDWSVGFMSDCLLEPVFLFACVLFFYGSPFCSGMQVVVSLFEA